MYFVWKSKSPKQTAGHVKMLTVSVLDDFSKELTQGCKQCSPASLLAFLYFFYTFSRHYCFTLTQIPLLLVPQMTPCTHNPSLLPLALPPSPSGATQVQGCSWDRSGLTQSKSQSHTYYANTAGAHSGNNQTLLQISNNPSFTFS